MITLHFFLRRTLRFGRCSYFLRFRDGFFAFLASFFAAFGFVFFYRGRRCLAQSLPFYRPDDACAFFTCIAFFRFLARRFTDVAGARSLEIRLKSILRSSILTVRRELPRDRPDDKSGRWIHPQALPYLVKAIVVIVQRRDMDRPSMNKSSRRTKNPKPVTLELRL